MLIRDFHTIIECSFLEKKNTIVMRFLDGTCLKIPVSNLPVRYKAKVEDWNEMVISDDKKSVSIVAKKGRSISIPAHIFYSTGRKF